MASDAIEIQKCDIREFLFAGGWNEAGDRRTCDTLLSRVRWVTTTRGRSKNEGRFRARAYTGTRIGIRIAQMVDDAGRATRRGERRTPSLFAERKQRVWWRTRLGVAIQSRTGVQLIPERGESESGRPIRCTCDPRHDRPAKS